MGRPRNISKMSTADLKELLFKYATLTWHKSGYDFFKVKQEYDSRFNLLCIKINKPCHPEIDEYFSDGCIMEIYDHAFKEYGGNQYLDIYEFMWFAGSDYFPSKGFDQVRTGSLEIVDE